MLIDLIDWAIVNQKTWRLIAELSVSIRFFDIGDIVAWMKSDSIAVDISSVDKISEKSYVLPSRRLLLIFFLSNSLS